MGEDTLATSNDQKIVLRRVSRELVSPLGDVVFVHGIGGNGIDTWTSAASVGKGEAEQEFVSYFPAVIATDFPELNFWTLDYAAKISEWQEKDIKFNELPRHCTQILEYLSSSGIGTRPTIFVCHSLGGIVTKEVLKQSCRSRFKRLKRVWQTTSAVSFIATPHKGANAANIIESINSVLPFVRPTGRLSELAHDNVYLEELSAWYREHAMPEDIETQAFYEQKKTKGLMVVPHYSANPDVVGCSPIGVNANHLEIVKPARKDDQVYRSLSGLIDFHLMDGKKSHVAADTGGIPPQTVVIGVVAKGKKILMVRRRNPINNLTWQFVAGRLRVGEETPEECIVREAKEEANIDAKVLRILGEAEDPEIPYKRVYVALEYLDGKLANSDSVENSEVRWVKIETVEKFVTTPIHPLVQSLLQEISMG